MQNIDVRMLKARSTLITRHAFFGALAMRLKIVERRDIPSMATDGTFLFYAKAFLDTLRDSEIVFVVAHEVLHCALGHHTRRGNRDPRLWNEACDYVINLMLVKAGFAIPASMRGYCDPTYEGLNAEQVYQILKQKQTQQQPKPEQDDGETSDEEGGDEANENEGDQECDSNSGGGTSPTSQDENASGGASSTEPSAGDQPSGSSGGTSTQEGSGNHQPSCGDPGGCGEVMDAAPAHDQAALDQAADEWQVYTRQAVSIARRYGEGKLPGFLEELVEDLNDPRTNWRDVLRRFVDPQTSTKDYTWSQPNRRYTPFGFYTPGVISDGVNHVAICIDTSGSIDTEWLKKFGGEAQDALDVGAVDKVTVIFADERVHRTAEYVTGERIDFTAQGRGGTAFAPTFAWINENAPDVSAAIYFTDLECRDFGDTPPYPVLWAAYGFDPRRTALNMSVVPFGEAIELQD